MRSIFLLVHLVLFCLTVPVAQSRDVPEGGLVRPDAPAYALHGPHWIGTREFMIEDPERPLAVTAWYPALNLKSKTESCEYVVQFPGMEPVTVLGQALAKASPNRLEAPYPLVIFVHALSASRVFNTYLTEHLASFGFVVLSADYADHLGNAPVSAALLTRPDDVLRQIAFAEALTAPGGALQGMIDTNRVAVIGDSFGGHTALATAGARLDLCYLRHNCDTYALASRPPICDLILNYEGALIRQMGLAAAPDGPLPAITDSRVKAAIGLAVGARLFGPDGLKDLKVPLLIIGGTRDRNVMPLADACPAYDWSGSASKVLILLEGGGPMLFGDTCERMPWLVSQMNAYWYCSDPVWDLERAHDLVKHLSVAFLLGALNVEPQSWAYLQPEALQRFPGIQFSTTLARPAPPILESSAPDVMHFQPETAISPLRAGRW